MLAKIINGKIIFPPDSILDQGSVIFNPSENLLKKYGFIDIPETELAQAVLDLVHPPLKYSKRKMIEFLGSDWEKCKKNLEEQNLIDAFIIEDTIADNDARFCFLLQQVKEHLGEKINMCLV